MTNVPVVIVGAGPTGITAATLLAQYGIECLVLDRWSSVYQQPRAVHLDDEIYRVVARLGIADEFAAISRPARGLRLLDPTMRVLAEFRRDTALSVHGYPQANMFDQPELEALLRSNLKRYPNAELRGNVEVTDVEERSDGRIRVTFVDRTDKSEHDVYADFVLGCDGANSVVRAQIGAAMRDMRFEQRWLVVDAATDADLDQWDGVHQVCDPVRAGTYMRIGLTRYRWEFRLLPGESADDFGSLAALNPLIAPWTSRVGDNELELIRVTEYTFRAQMADRWRRGNVFLLGDAAHLTPPFIGQGMGAGLRDAMNLAWKLAGVIAGDLPRAALDSYEQERKPHTRHMIRLALSVGWSMTAGGEFGNLIRRLVLTRMKFVPGLRSKVIDSRTPALRRSAFVTRPRVHRQLAGTLCPNPVLADARRLDSILRDGFALITTVPPNDMQHRRPIPALHGSPPARTRRVAVEASGLRTAEVRRMQSGPAQRQDVHFRDQRDNLLPWGGATFDILGPLNRRAFKSLPGSLRMLAYAHRVVRERSLIEGSVGHEVLLAADARRVSHDELAPLMVDYIGTSLDTTISAISNALHLFAANPKQCQLLKDDPSVIPNAVNEVVRYETPLRAFSRQARADTDIAGYPIPAGARVLVVYASANRDEYEWEAPDTFDIRRDATRQLGFGHGAHACAGQGLARLETQAMLRALVERVDRIELTAQPTWAVNNIIRRHERLPLKLIAS